MCQLFQNLFSNSIKFRSDKIPEIVVSVEKQIATWLFRVKDNGIGLDPKHGNRIFQMFKRLHTKTEYPGSEDRPRTLSSGGRASRRYDRGRVEPWGGRSFLVHTSHQATTLRTEREM